MDGKKVLHLIQPIEHIPISLEYWDFGRENLPPSPQQMGFCDDWLTKDPLLLG